MSVGRLCKRVCVKEALEMSNSHQGPEYQGICSRLGGKTGRQTGSLSHYPIIFPGIFVEACELLNFSETEPKYRRE